MSKPFSSIKSTQMGMEDKLTFGKYKGCRICDLIDDNYEYLIFLSAKGIVQYNLIVMEKILKVAGFEREKIHYQQEEAPWEDGFLGYEDYGDLLF